MQHYAQLVPEDILLLARYQPNHPLHREVVSILANPGSDLSGLSGLLARGRPLPQPPALPAADHTPTLPQVVATRCAALIANGLVEYLVAVLKSCDRSRPHVHLARRALWVLVNLCLQPTCLAAVVARLLAAPGAYSASRSAETVGVPTGGGVPLRRGGAARGASLAAPRHSPSALASRPLAAGPGLPPPAAHHPTAAAPAPQCDLVFLIDLLQSHRDHIEVVEPLVALFWQMAVGFSEYRQAPAGRAGPGVPDHHRPGSPSAPGTLATAGAPGRRGSPHGRPPGADLDASALDSLCLLPELVLLSPGRLRGQKPAGAAAGATPADPHGGGAPPLPGEEDLLGLLATDPGRAAALPARRAAALLVQWLQHPHASLVLGRFGDVARLIERRASLDARALSARGGPLSGNVIGNAGAGADALRATHERHVTAVARLQDIQAVLAGARARPEPVPLAGHMSRVVF